MPYNPFTDFTLEECKVRRREIAERLLENVDSVSHPSTGSVKNGSRSVDMENLKYLDSRIAELEGTPDTTRPRIGIIRLVAGDYR